MKRFAELLDRLVLTPQRNMKLRLLRDYFRDTPDPDRGYALAVLTGELAIASVKPAMLRAVITARMDETLFYYSYDYVGDLAETIALAWPAKGSTALGGSEAMAAAGEGGLAPMAPLPPRARRTARAWPKPPDPNRVAEESGTMTLSLPLFMAAPEMPSAPGIGHNAPPLTLGEVVERLQSASRLEGPRLVEGWLDQLDSNGRWGLIKLVGGALRVGVSARLTKQALADLGGREVNDIEEIWHSVEPPYRSLFAWLQDGGPMPIRTAAAPFRPVMLSHAIADSELPAITPEAYAAEWKWDGIRVQAVVEGGTRRLYSRTAEDISDAFPDLLDALTFEGAIDGELLVGGKTVDGFHLGSFGDLQQRLNRKGVAERTMRSFPAFLRAYDCLVDGAEDLRRLPFRERRAHLETLVAKADSDRIDLSPLIPFRDGAELQALRAAPPDVVIEGLMLKRWDSVYEPGRPKGPWFKWKRDPHTIDAVLMYAQRGHGKRSSFYSDYTFGVWQQGPEGDELVPVGKAYFGFTDEELTEIDRFVRNNTTARFGPVREVVHQPDAGLVLEVAFEGLNRSTRHRSGVAMRFPRIARLRWDKPPAEADRLETLAALIRD